MKFTATIFAILTLTITGCSDEPVYTVKELAEDDALFKQVKALCGDGSYSGVTCENLKKATTKRLWRVD